MNMFNTTGARIIVCCCYKEISSEDSAKLDMQAMKIAKERFGYVDETTTSPEPQLPLLTNTRLDDVERTVMVAFNRSKQTLGINKKAKEKSG